ncbi:PLP-dependent aminotransferase family protein [Paucibacter sp. AS339]|uniref:MocR-like pyridoxine biosynthesis transcription factor PdxR n=1 Tax=Paucibacter hankyongi TaxID=3133434 RepID=UPI0030A15A2C
MNPTNLADWLLQRLHGEAAMNRQLHDLLLQAVLQGQLAAGSKLPSSRWLAQELGVARNTVIDAYENLLAQGCLITRAGSGTYVAEFERDALQGMGRTVAARVQAAPTLSKRGQALFAHAGVAARQWGAFMPGVPDVTEFPVRTWLRLHNRRWHEARPERLSYAPGGGLPELREALAEHLRVARSVQCTAEQIIITSGSHQAVDLAARLLTDPGDTVWLEEPCYWGLRSTLQSLSLRVQAQPVDAEGLRWPAKLKGAAPRLLLATPSHQYPLGMVMSLSRRQQLLEHCRKHGSWIVEDDYDSEFRFGTRPIACLQGLDGGDRVLYVGSFSKTLFPGLRLGYLVVPKVLAAPFAKASAELYREGQLQQQATLADFIREGHLGNHVRRMRVLYGKRRECLLEAVQASFGDQLPVLGDNAGLHLVLQLPKGTDDRRIEANAAAAGIAVRALSNYYSSRTSASAGLLLGYACVPEAQIRPAFRVLAEVLRKELP